MPSIFELEYSKTIDTPLNKFQNNLPTLNNENSIIVNLGKNDILNIIQNTVAVRVISEEGKTTIMSNDKFTVDYSDKETPLVIFGI